MKDGEDNRPEYLSTEIFALKNEALSLSLLLQVVVVVGEDNGGVGGDGSGDISKAFVGENINVSFFKDFVVHIDVCGGVVVVVWWW